MGGAPGCKRRAVRGAPRHRLSASPPASSVSGHAVRMARAARWGPPWQPAARRRAAQACVGTHERACRGCWTGVSGWGRVGSSGVPRGDGRGTSGSAMWGRRGEGWAGARWLRRAVCGLPRHRRHGRGERRCRNAADRRARYGTPPAVGTGRGMRLAPSPCDHGLLAGARHLGHTHEAKH